MPAGSDVQAEGGQRGDFLDATDLGSSRRNAGKATLDALPGPPADGRLGTGDTFNRPMDAD